MRTDDIANPVLREYIELLQAEIGDIEDRTDEHLGTIGCYIPGHRIIIDDDEKVNKEE